MPNEQIFRITANILSFKLNESNTYTLLSDPYQILSSIVNSDRSLNTCVIVGVIRVKMYRNLMPFVKYKPVNILGIYYGISCVKTYFLLVQL